MRGSVRGSVSGGAKAGEEREMSDPSTFPSSRPSSSISHSHPSPSSHPSLSSHSSLSLLGVSVLYHPQQRAHRGHSQQQRSVRVTIPRSRYIATIPCPTAQASRIQLAQRGVRNGLIVNRRHPHCPAYVLISCHLRHQSTIIRTHSHHYTCVTTRYHHSRVQHSVSTPL